MKLIPIIGLLLCVATTNVVAQTALNKRLVASNTLRVNALTERTVNSPGNAVLVKEFAVYYGGTVRLKWQWKSDGSNLAFISVGGGVGCEFAPNTSSANYVLDTCDLSLGQGETIRLELQGQTASIRNVRLFFDIVESDKPAVATMN